MGLEDTSNEEAENIIIQNGRIGQGILSVRVIKAGQNMGSEKKLAIESIEMHETIIIAIQ